jgi:hypothetical protein
MSLIAAAVLNLMLIALACTNNLVAAILWGKMVRNALN